MELGGKSVAILLDDVDLAKFVSDVATTCIPFVGQACWSNSRILAPRSRYDEVVDALEAALRAIPVGDPLDKRTVYGPLAAERHRDRVESYVQVGLDEGAELVTGGRRPEHLPRGFFYEPTLFSGVSNAMRIAREEIFGPVIGVIPYESVSEAVRISNDSNYGLGGVIYTADHSHGVAVARQLETGTVGINRYTNDFNSPFGGYKDSGLGRELGPEGMEAYCQYKTVYL